MSLDLILSRLQGVRASGDSYRSKCPSHDSKGLTLKVTEANNGDVLVHCFAGCSAKEVVESIGLNEKDLFKESFENKNQKYYSRAELDELKTQYFYVSIATEDLQKNGFIEDKDKLKLRQCLKSLNKELPFLEKSAYQDTYRCVYLVMSKFFDSMNNKGA